MYGQVAGAAAFLGLCRADCRGANGYELRKHVDRRACIPTAMAAGKTYLLKVTLSENSQGIALQNDASITRYNNRLEARYTLSDMRGNVLTTGTQTELSAYKRGDLALRHPGGRAGCQQGAPGPGCGRTHSSRSGASGFRQHKEMIVKSHEADRYGGLAAQGAERGAGLWPRCRAGAGSVPRSCLKAWCPTSPMPSMSPTSVKLRCWPIRRGWADEAAAISMMGGRRVVRVRGAGNELADLLDSFLDDPKGDALVVIEGGRPGQDRRPA